MAGYPSAWASPNTGSGFSFDTNNGDYGYGSKNFRIEWDPGVDCTVVFTNGGGVVSAFVQSDANATTNPANGIRTLHLNGQGIVNGCAWQGSGNSWTQCPRHPTANAGDPIQFDNQLPGSPIAVSLFPK